MSDARPSAVFLCRGSARDGLGHVMRSRTVALAGRDRLDPRLIVIGDRCARPLLDARDLEYEITPTDDAAANALAAIDPDIVFFDTLRLERDAFDRVRAGRFAIGLSPIFERQRDLDLVFHRTRALSPQLEEIQRLGRLRAGLEYAVIRPACQPIADAAFDAALSAERLSIALSMGGGDAGNLTLAALRELSTLDRPLLIWCLLGEGYGHCYNELAAAASASSHEVLLAKTSDSMWRVLSQCALAVLAGGAVTYEAARAGLPSINLFPDPDHAFLASELIDRGASLSAGDSLARAAQLVARLEASRDRLSDMRARCQSLIDGQGAQRVVNQTLALCAARRTAAA
jgi:spore coat polysaccharide biosynthesis predicted glycosyltransferase SpsG